MSSSLDFVSRAVRVSSLLAGHFSDRSNLLVAQNSCFASQIFILSNLLIVLSMHYHNVIILLLERSALVSSGNDAWSLAPRQIDQNPSQIIAKSKIFLQTLVHLYYLRHSFEAVDTFMTQFLSLTAFIAINVLKEGTPTAAMDDLRSTALLCTKGLYDQGQCFYLARITFKVVRDSLNPSDAETLKRFVRTTNPSHDEEQIRAEEIQSMFPVNIISIDDDAEQQTLSNWVKPLIDLTVDSPPNM